MNISSFDGYITSYGVELFRCHDNGSIPCYIALNTPIQPPLHKNPLAC